jgi:hypothetical protein
MAQRRICYSELCILGDPAYLAFDGKSWKLDEIAVNELYCAIANAGADSQRLLPWGVWGARPHGMRSQFSPYELEGDRFQLSRWNDFYWPIVRRVIEIARSYEIETLFCFGDNCQFHGSYKKWSPWVTNVNGISTLFEPSAYPYFKKWIERCLAELSPLSVKWSWGNEMDNAGMRELAKKVIHPFIADGRIAPAVCTYGAGIGEATYENGEYRETKISTQDWLKADVGEAFGEPAKLAIWREVHGCGEKGYPTPPHRLDQALSWWGNHPIKIFLSDDGVWDGDSACDFEADTGHRRPSGERWRTMVKTALAYRNSFVFEHLPKGGDVDCQKATIKEIYRALYGKDPEEKWHYEPPSPPPPLVKRKICASSGLAPGPYCPAVIEISVPEGTPAFPLCAEHTAPPEPKSCYEKYIKGRPISKWQVGAFLRCLLGG